MPRTRGLWLKRLATVLLSTLFALLLAEGGVRLVGAGVTTITRGRLHAFDPDVGWICHPGTDLRYALPGSIDVRVRCNSRGLRDGARLLVVNATAKEAVDQMFHCVVASRVAAAEQPDPDRPSRRLGAVCAVLGIPFLDLIPAFRQHPDPPSLYLEHDLHWTAEGHVIAARETARKIRSMGR